MKALKITISILALFMAIYSLYTASAYGCNPDTSWIVELCVVSFIISVSVGVASLFSLEN